MKRLFSILFIFIGSQIFADSFHKYDMKLVHTFITGTKEGEIQTMMLDPGDNGPYSFAFDQYGNIYIPDPLNSRLNKYNKNYDYLMKYDKDYSLAYAKLLYIDTPEIDFRVYFYYGFKYYNKDGEKKIHISTRGNKNVIRNGFFYFDNTVYIELEGNKWISVENPSVDWKENEKNILDEEITMKKLKAGKLITENGQQKMLRLDDKDRLLLDDELITKNIHTFVNYWHEKHAEDNMTGKDLVELPYTKRITDLKDLTFYGKDNYGNTYWDYGRFSILVFDKNGWLIDGIRYVEKIEGGLVPLIAIHPTGDIYLLDYDWDGVYLFKIDKKW